MIKKNTYNFLIKKKDIFWSVKYFSFAIIAAFALSIAMYSVMLLVSEPAYVDEAIITTASTAIAKVEVTAEYISPMWSVFIFNTIAVFSAVIGTSLFSYIHPMMIGEIELRSKHPVYAHFSIILEKMMMPANRLIQKLVTIADKDFPSISAKTEDDTDSMWKNCGYENVDYHKFAYILPYTVPVMIILVNGFLIGILMAFFTFNGALTGFQIFGTKGILIGIIYNLIYFVISILPHGIIELPVILLAAALGYRFAFVQSHEVKNEDLFLGDTIEIAKKDVAQVIEITKNYMSSLYVRKMLVLMVCMLLLAAYIEIYVTLGIVETVMQALDTIIEAGLP
jgi:uncharacterized membrane protein SpoIIM required for sporulation